MEEPSLPFLARHEFLIRRLHSLSGLLPIGGYMTFHLIANASVLSGPGTYQQNVYKIYALGVLLPVMEWGVVILPILFHAAIGVAIVLGMVPNTTRYPYMSNWRYTLQRITGIIAFAFIMWHMFHMRGWFHAELWRTYVDIPLGGANFRPYNAASTAGLALQSPIVVTLYAIGILACVYHLANGIWAMGITWGVWTSPPAQKRALGVCAVFGVALGLIGLGALTGLHEVGQGEALEDARNYENLIYQNLVDTGQVLPNPERRAQPEAGKAAPATGKSPGD